MNQHTDHRSFLRSRRRIGALTFLAVAAVLLVFDHWTHILRSNLILGAVLLACAPMHLFMHGGHGGGSKGGE